MDTFQNSPCLKCGTALTPGMRFCSACGAPAPTPAPSFCSSCGAALTVGTQFCVSCGAPTAPTPVKVSLVGIDRNPLTACIVVLLVCGAISLLGWYPLSLPGRLIRTILPLWTCGGYTPGSAAMYGCAFKVGAIHMTPPLLLGIGLFMARKTLIQWVKALLPKLPAGSQFLVAPALATICFAIPWSTAHFEASFMTGILPVTVFPAVIGLYTYLTLTFGPRLQTRLVKVFDTRDRIPKAGRLAIAVLVPLVVSLLITNQERVTEPGLKEQLVVLLSLCTGYLALAPRQGSLLEGAQQAMAREPGTA